MGTRVVSLFFPHLVAERSMRRQPELRQQTFVQATFERNRQVVKAVSPKARQQGLAVGMAVADCRALVPDLQVLDYVAEQPAQLLQALAEWCIRYTPVVAVDGSDGLLLDAAGCTHLWGGEANYLADLQGRLKQIGYTTQCGMADTVGTAWALCRFAANGTVAPSGQEARLLAPMPPAALRLDNELVARFEKLGLSTLGSFMTLPRTALRRRFGAIVLRRLDQALGQELEPLEAVHPLVPYQEHLPCLEPVRTATAIGLALEHLLQALCLRLQRESKGLRRCTLQCFRVDGARQSIAITTTQASRNALHLFKLFENRIAELEPDLGYEAFVLQAAGVEDLQGTQDALWTAVSNSDSDFAELIDRLSAKAADGVVKHYLPAEHYWPERCVVPAQQVSAKPATAWRSNLHWPLHLLQEPEAVEAIVPVPDYPPLVFIYKGQRHTVKKADGPERIEQEWWLQTGLYRDYYCVEDEEARRYWLFRLGDNQSGDARWFIHGFFT